MQTQTRLVHELTALPVNFWLNNVQQLCCMHDTEVFDGPIFAYPIRCDGNVWYVRGVFCSLECTKRYILENSVQYDTLSLFAYMCHSVYQHTAKVDPAPSRYILKKFFPWEGGLTIEEFRAGANKSDIVMPPIFPFVNDRTFRLESVYDLPELGSSTVEEEGVNPVVVPEQEDCNILYPSRSITTLNNYLDTIVTEPSGTTAELSDYSADSDEVADLSE
jgi:hypothetical protein